MSLDLQTHGHRRFNPLTGEWILVSPHRNARPWQGQVETPRHTAAPEYDPACYLCPGNPRAGGIRNPAYSSTFVFDNDFPAMNADGPPGRLDVDGLLIAEGEQGICRVICYSPRHDLTLAKMQQRDVRALVDTWTAQYVELGGKPFVNAVQIFENRGAMMGASNPHPHCQVWANAAVPSEPARENDSLRRWRDTHGACLLCTYVALEERRRERIVCANDDFVALVPFWAVWPFETLVLGRRHTKGLDDLSPSERDAFADVLRQLTARYDSLFGVPFPYSMGIHQRPTDGQPHDECHLHVHFYPPLLRSATVRKFMVGYEMLAAAQRDVTPESAAERLRACRAHENAS